MSFRAAIAVAWVCVVGVSCIRSTAADAGEVDAGLVGPSCDSPEDCKDAAFLGVCRQNVCVADVPCGDDVECGLGERCADGRCLFTGCSQDAQCASGKCRPDVFSCEECGRDNECPSDKPRCDTAGHRCVSCLSDVECPAPGPARCSPLGQCAHCVEDKHCPNGLSCNAAGVCVGSALNGPCSDGVACGQGLLCVTVNTAGRCLPLCNLFRPTCPQGNICYSPYGSAAQLIFEDGAPVGFCFAPQAGLRSVNEPCFTTAAGSNCQRNLECVPRTATESVCRSYCDPAAQNNCTSGDVCHPFNGDFQGHRYGLCYPDNGWGDACGADAGCGDGQTCRLRADPAALNDFTPQCQFPVGDAGALAPCDNALQCQSGACREDGDYLTASYFCFQQCDTDAECNAGGRAGRCDSDFLLSEGNSFGFIRGCRPYCASNADCQNYDGGMVCKARVNLFSGAHELRQACAVPEGSGDLGATCTAATDCRSGFCRFNDWRGVIRRGVCDAPCRQADDCTLRDGGVGALAQCATAPFYAATGADGLPATADDLAYEATLCVSPACADDAECSADAGRFCVPSGERVDAGAVFRCEGRANGGTLPGTSSCSADNQCQSGVCGTLTGPPFGRACLQACGPNTACLGGTTCREGGLSIGTRFGPLNVRACVP